MMPTPPPLRTANKDAEHLRLLATFHYVLGAVGLVFACFPLIHVFVGLAMIFIPDSRQAGGARDPGTVFFGVVFVTLGILYVLTGWALSICVMYSGRMIKQRRRRTFSFVIAAILCALAPFGTVLGVFSIIVLNRDSVKALYGEPASAST